LKSSLKSAWKKHGYFNVTGFTVLKLGTVQAAFFREVSSTNKILIFNHDFLHSGTTYADFNHDFNHDLSHGETPF